MSMAAGRSIEVDFLRGAVLIVIAIDHISRGILQHAMLHSYAYCDAAEVFVFLGGYASAAAYAAVLSRNGESGARRRFLRRAGEIYRAYLLTAVLMLVGGALLTRLPCAQAAMADTGWPVFARQPWQTLADIALFRRQPYLSAVLPMYVLFALMVPVIVPVTRRAPVAALCASLAVWLAAPWLVMLLPSAGEGSWPFNPFAWQLMFMLGLLVRVHPVSAETLASVTGKRVTQAAFVVALTFAFVKLCIDSHPSPGFMKQNLASVRIVSFVSIAWLCAQAVRLGWLRALAERLPGVVTIGRQGLICFVGGTVVSMSIDAALAFARVQTGDLWTDWPIRLLGDASAVALLVLLGHCASVLKARMRPVAMPAAMAYFPARSRERK